MNYELTISNYFIHAQNMTFYSTLLQSVPLPGNPQRKKKILDPAIVTLFLLQPDPPPSEKGKVMRPSQEKVWGPRCKALGKVTTPPTGRFVHYTLEVNQRQ